MLEPTHILAGISVVLLFMSFEEWTNPFGRSQLHRLNGNGAVAGGGAERAARLLLAAVGFGAVGSSLAVAGWFAA